MPKSFQPRPPSDKADQRGRHWQHQYSRQRKYKKANRKNMVKTSRRGAYKPARKKQMVIRRNPIVETYKYQSAPAVNSSTPLSRLTAYNMILNQAFVCAYTQKLDIPNDGLSTVVNLGPSCRGRDIYSKMTATKLRFDFPEDDFQINDNYTPPTVYHGWVKKTMFKTALTVPTPGNVVQGDFGNLINNAMTGQFNEANDKLDFRDRRPTEYVILGKRQIKPNLNKSISNRGNATTYIETGNAHTTTEWHGSLPPVFHTCRWKVNRKIGLQMSNSWLGGTPGTDEARFYPSDCWIPFIIVFNPSFAKQHADGETGTRGQILVSYNSVHYYTDS